MAKMKYLIAKKDITTLDGFTWTVGDIYEIYESDHRFHLWSNEGVLQYNNYWKKEALKNFRELERV